MKTAGYRLVWFLAYLVCIAGLVMVFLGLIGNRNAPLFDDVGSPKGYHEISLERFRRADAVAKTGVAVFGAGAALMTVPLFAGRRGRRHSCS